MNRLNEQREKKTYQGPWYTLLTYVTDIKSNLTKRGYGCNLNLKIKNFDFESCNHIFTPDIKSIMLVINFLKSGKNKKEVKNDLLSMMAPPVIQSCNQTFF